MTLELNKPYIVKRVASNDQVLHYLPLDGFCDGVEIDKPVLAKRVASNDGVLHYLLGDQKLENDGTLTIGKPYFAKRVASNDGVLHYLVGGKVCETGCCNCENLTTGAFPATLPFTVTDSCFGDVWTGDLIDATGTYSGGYCVPGFGPSEVGTEVAAAYVKSQLTLGDAVSVTELACSGASVSLVDTLEYDKRDLLVLCNRIRCDDLVTTYHVWSVWYRRELINGSDIKLVNGVKVLTLLSCDPLTFETEMEWACYTGSPASFSNVPNSPINDYEAYCDTFEGIAEPQYTVYQNCNGGTAQIDIG